MLSVNTVIRSLTLFFWAVTAFAATSFGDHIISDDVSRVTVGAAIVGTLEYIAARHAKPAAEVYEAGKAMGRRELLLEQSSADRVVSLTERRKVRRTQAEALRDGAL